MSFATINLEAEYPTVGEARRRLASEIQSAKARGVHVLKVIHGWGSTARVEDSDLPSVNPFDSASKRAKPAPEYYPVLRTMSELPKD